MTVRTVIFVWLGLLTLLAGTVIVTLRGPALFAPGINLVIAGVQAVMLVWFYMHLREMTGLVRLAAGSALLWLTIMFALTFNDLLARL